MNKLLLLFLGCFAFISLVSSEAIQFSTDACTELKPPSKTQPQDKSKTPYIIKLSKIKIKAGESMEVTIVGKREDTFKGFLIQARLGATPKGTFSAKDNSVKLLNCGAGTANTATHSSFSDKKEVTITWTAPKDLKDTVIFYVTIAKNDEEVWVAQRSRTLVVT